MKKSSSKPDGCGLRLNIELPPGTGIGVSPDDDDDDNNTTVLCVVFKGVANTKKTTCQSFLQIYYDFWSFS